MADPYTHALDQDLVGSEVHRLIPEPDRDQRRNSPKPPAWAAGGMRNCTGLLRFYKDVR